MYILLKFRLIVPSLIFDLNIANYPSISKIEVYVYSSKIIDYLTIERLSYHFQGILHDLNIEKGTYQLIVSSPGVERKLKTKRHFELALAEPITLKTFNDIAGQYVINGELIEVGDKSLSMITDSGSNVSVEFNNIKNARVKLITNEKEMIG